MVSIDYFVDFEVVFHNEVCLLHIIDQIVFRLLVQLQSNDFGSSKLIDFFFRKVYAVLLELKHHDFLRLAILFHVEQFVVVPSNQMLSDHILFVALHYRVRTVQRLCHNAIIELEH